MLGPISSLSTPAPAIARSSCPCGVTNFTRHCKKPGSSSSCPPITARPSLTRATPEVLGFHESLVTSHVSSPSATGAPSFSNDTKKRTSSPRPYEPSARSGATSSRYPSASFIWLWAETAATAKTVKIAVSNRFLLMILLCSIDFKKSRYGPCSGRTSPRKNRFLPRTGTQ